jgi:DNA-binding HxlR family transcriptional regulator
VLEAGARFRTRRGQGEPRSEGDGAVFEETASHQVASRDGETCATGASVADVLRLLSVGATGPILMALGKGPLRTKGLTEEVPGYAPRTIYRYAGKLAELDVVERDEEPGVPSKVVHRLTDPCGSVLFELMDSFAAASLSRLPNGKIDAHAWASLGLLADLWESGMVEQLSCEPRSATQLAQAEHGLSYHQVNRRANLFKVGGLLSEAPGNGRRRCYSLTEKARRAMALIAGIGRWRHDYVVPEDQMGLTEPEVATVVRTALPLVRMPEHARKGMRLEILKSEKPYGREDETLWACVEPGGEVQSCASPIPSVDGWARGKVNSWLAASLDGKRERMEMGGDTRFVDACLRQLHQVLWEPAG